MISYVIIDNVTVIYGFPFGFNSSVIMGSVNDMALLIGNKEIKNA